MHDNANAHANDARRTVYRGINHPRHATPAAPLFDATSAPTRNRYRPNPEPTHYVDAAIAQTIKAIATSRRSAMRLHAKVSAAAACTPRPVRLIAPDGTVKRATFAHPDAITRPVCVIKRADLSKIKDQRVITINAHVPAPGVKVYTRDTEREARELGLPAVAPTATPATVEPSVKVYTGRTLPAGHARTEFRADAPKVHTVDNRLAKRW